MGNPQPSSTSPQQASCEIHPTFVQSLFATSGLENGVKLKDIHKPVDGKKPAQIEEV